MKFHAASDLDRFQLQLNFFHPSYHLSVNHKEKSKLYRTGIRIKKWGYRDWIGPDCGGFGYNPAQPVQRASTKSQQSSMTAAKRSGRPLPSMAVRPSDAVAALHPGCAWAPVLDRLVHLRLPGYMLKIWRLDVKQSKAKKLSIIIPLLLYHGPQKWTAKEKFSSLLSGPVDTMAGYIPDFRYILYDLSRYSDEDIKGTVTARVVMLIFKYIFDPDFARKMPGIFSLLKDLSEKETGLQYFESLIKYIFSNVEDITTEEFKTIISNTLSEDKGGMIMTLAEKLRNEGLEQGLGKGLIEGIELAVSIKFGDAGESKTVMTKIKSIKDINRLKALKGKIKSAKSIPELIRFIDN